MKIRKNESVEQGVPGYGPQVVAMQAPPHAATYTGTAVGRRLNPDVRQAYNQKGFYYVGAIID